MAGILAVGTPQRSKSRKKPKNQIVHQNHQKWSIFTSFYQILEVDTDTETAHPDEANEEK